MSKIPEPGSSLFSVGVSPAEVLYSSILCVSAPPRESVFLLVTHWK
jgi:hypothetical protein